MVDFKPYDYHFWDDPYLKSAGAKFAGVYVAFHPFMQISPDCESLIWEPEEGLIDPDHAMPSRREANSYEKRHGLEVPWSTIMVGAKLNGPHEIQIAYNSYWKRGKDEARPARRLPPSVFSVSSVVKKSPLTLAKKIYSG